MTLADAPAFLALVGIAAYAVLGGADFGAGFWQLTPGTGARSRAVREHAYHAMGPVWEANHVWLIFVLVVCWTAYPVAFASIASTLSVALFAAALGIILRGTAYALRSGAVTLQEQRRIELVFALSSILTPFALGAAVGGIASGRVPVGNAKGDPVTSWLNPTSILVGTLAVATAAYLAAVYLAADAVRARDPDLARAFRARALATGVVAGGIAFLGLVVLRLDARPIWEKLTEGWGLAAVVTSAAAGVGTLALVRQSRFGLARLTAAVAVAAIVAGWAIAQRPRLLPGLTIQEAAAGRTTLVALLVATALGAVVLAPSLVLLFGLFLRGTFDVRRPNRAVPRPASPPVRGRPRVLAPLAAAGLAAGVPLTTLTDEAWTIALGLVALFVFIGSAFLAIAMPRSATGQPGHD
jgi:cytochrome d ubiquinol oxidase subunit II